MGINGDLFSTIKGSTINHLGGHGAKRKNKFRSEGHRKKKLLFGGSPKKKICSRKSAPRPPDD